MATLYNLEHPLVDQILVYQELQDTLERDNFGEWAVICDSKLIGTYRSYEKATADARSQGVNVLNCLIRQVGVEAPVILSYGR